MVRGCWVGLHEKELRKWKSRDRQINFKHPKYKTNHFFCISNQSYSNNIIYIKWTVNVVLKTFIAYISFFFPVVSNKIVMANASNHVVVSLNEILGAFISIWLWVRLFRTFFFVKLVDTRIYEWLWMFRVYTLTCDIYLNGNIHHSHLQWNEKKP